MHDIINIESEFIKNFIAKSISKVLENKDLSVNFQLKELHVENNYGNIIIYIDGNVEMSNECLKMLLHKFYFLKDFLVSIRHISKKAQKTMLQGGTNCYLKKKNFDIKVDLNKSDCIKTESGVNVYVNGNAYMSEVDLQRILKDTNLL